MADKVHKFIAQSGYTSRRKAESLVEEGRVTINGRPAEIGDRVSSTDEVRVDETPVAPPQSYTYLKLYKPAGYVCTHRQFSGEKSMFALLPQRFHSLSLAGRLDKDSRGLVLISDDGAWINEMTHPSYNHEKEYEVTLTAPAPGRDTKRMLETGMYHEGDFLQAAEVTPLNSATFRLVLTYGKKRHIRRMFEALGYTVSDLLRTRVGTYTFEGLEEGEFEEISG